MVSVRYVRKQRFSVFKYSFLESREFETKEYNCLMGQMKHDHYGIINKLCPLFLLVIRLMSSVKAIHHSCSTEHLGKTTTKERECLFCSPKVSLAPSSFFGEIINV